MKLGLQIVRFDWPGTPDNTGQVLSEVARTADRAGFSSLWCMDHFYQIGIGHGSEDSPMHESYTNLSFMAAATRNVKLGTMVTGSFYRHPGVLVKMVTTLDVLSGGRAVLGIGAGWNEKESRGLGVPFPTLKTRYEMLEEALQIAHHMWRDDRTSFEGKYYRLEEPICSPQPISRPHPTILVGGEGERKTARLTAKYGDACNWVLGTPLKEFTQWHNDLFKGRKERLRRKVTALKKRCEEVGRDFYEIELTVLGPVRIGEDAMTPSFMVETCRELSELGISHYIFNMANSHEITPIEVIGEEVIPEVKAL
jgi:F420-dependent oxidoreductase-like protein